MISILKRNRWQKIPGKCNWNAPDVLAQKHGHAWKERMSESTQH